MMFKVTIQRTITTVVEVDAVSPAEARRQIHAYGIIEAISDYPVLEETTAARIKSAEAV